MLEPMSSGLFVKKNPVFYVVCAVVIIVVLIGVYKYGNKAGYTVGYAKAQADIQALQQEAARKGAEEAAKSANPFQAVNPLEGVEANPFLKVKKVLNPFEN